MNAIEIKNDNIEIEIDIDLVLGEESQVVRIHRGEQRDGLPGSGEVEPEAIKTVCPASITRPATVGLSAFAKVPDPPKPWRRRAKADERFSTRVHPP